MLVGQPIRRSPMPCCLPLTTFCCPVCCPFPWLTRLAQLVQHALRQGEDLTARLHQARGGMHLHGAIGGRLRGRVLSGEVMRGKGRGRLYNGITAAVAEELEAMHTAASSHVPCIHPASSWLPPSTTHRPAVKLDQHLFEIFLLRQGHWQAASLEGRRSGVTSMSSCVLQV